MAAVHPKTEEEPTSETSYISTIPRIMDSVQHSIAIKIRTLSQAFRESVTIATLNLPSMLVGGQRQMTR